MVRLRRRHRQGVPRPRQGARPRRASALEGGPAGRRLPRLDRRPQLLAGGLRPEAELHLQRRSRDGRRPDPEEADADAEEAQVPARRHLPRARQRELRQLPARLEGSRLDQRDRRLDRQARLEVRHAGARAGRGQPDGERPRVRRWRRRRSPRVRLEDRQGAVDVPDGTPDRRRADDLHRPAARSSSRSRSVARRPRRTAASRRSCRCSRSGAARPSRRSRRGSRRCSRLPRRRADDAEQACVRAGAGLGHPRALGARPGSCRWRPHRRSPGRSRSGCGTRTAPTSCR